ncbi:class I histocompatibility antigen, F10 alpha chain-like isoform X2 [Eleutherodactylus coqui]|uniref:class I histocompatibility antigen, F10 alpha chain-like isoform X2 n=1 Tax=Eleutherodactylus coqui TaxID=57060 RepID=UPI003461AF57
MMKMFPLIVLLLHSSAVYSDSHSLRYYHTVVSAPGPGIPEYSYVGYVDDQEITNYNSVSRRMLPRAEWIKKEEPEYWERETQIGKGAEAVFRHNVRTLMERFNQTGGFHSVQWMIGCELDDDGSIRGYDQHRYDGGEFIALDTQTWTYTATMSQALITTQRWNSPEERAGETVRNYLENICMEGLKKYVENGREELERRVRPTVKVSGQHKDGTLMLHCQVYGFHPRRVDVKWMKNGVDDIPTYETTHVLPNPDGTYQIRVSADVMPGEDDSYSCYVDHSSLGAPLNIVWEPPSSWVTPVAVAVVVVALLVAAVVGFLLYSRNKAGYRTASKPDKFSSGIQQFSPINLSLFPCVI